MPCIRFTLSASLTALAIAWPSMGDEVEATDPVASMSASDPEYEATIRPFLAQHCHRCHGEQKQKAGLRIDDLSSDFVAGPALEQWLEVVEKLVTGEMPPEGLAQRPTPQESGRVAEWIAGRIEAGRAERLARRERVSFHRLTREEYANSIHDLLGVHFDVADAAGLNEDDRWRGFDRIGTVLSLSSSHMQKYLAAAEAILSEAYPDVVGEPSGARLSAIELVGGPETYGEKNFARVEAEDRTREIRIDLWPGQHVPIVRLQDVGQRAGVYRFRIQLSGLPSGDGRAAHLTVHATTVDRLLFEQDVDSPEGEPVVVEFEAHLPAGPHELKIANSAAGPSILTRLGRSGNRPFFSVAEGRIPWQLELKDDDGMLMHPVLILDWFECEGPLASDAHTTRHEYIPSAADEAAPDRGLGAARSRLTVFTERAFRRPLRAGEIDPFVQLLEAELASGANLRSAVKTGMLAVLCSQSFLYLEEGAPERATPGLNGWELAARLSYFLWSTAPDAELLALARTGELLAPATLRSQLTRLLADPRAERLAKSFARQWLQLERVGMFTPNRELYPDYDKHLERSMVRETTSFFGEVLARNLGLDQFLESDWTMLNPRMARHYGIANVKEDRFQRVALESGNRRGGILTHASVLSLTSDGTRHRPVHRGVWVSESILGQYPPAPPAAVEPIEPTPIDAAKATVRMRLDAHKASPSCFACHKKIDPLGFAFDNYDAIGRWRTEERVATGTGVNPPVDASGVLPDGRTFSSAAGLKSLLVDDLDRFAAAFIEKLATYALRRPLGPNDRAGLEGVVNLSSVTGHRLQDIVEALVLSELFANR